MIVEDFNVTPAELARTAWFHFVRGNLVVPEETSGEGRALDVLLVIDSFLPYVSNV